MDSKNKKILIYGAGAVGGYYGGMLVKAGYDVTFVARGETYEILKEHGLYLEIDGKAETLKVNVTNDPKNQCTKNFDYIIICTKTHNTEEIAKSLNGVVGESTTLLSFQNGVEAEEILSKEFGEEKVIGAFVYLASQNIGPGKVQMMGNQTITIGELNGGTSDRTLELQEIFKDSQVKCIASENVLGDMWVKLAWNTAFNSLSVIHESTIGPLLKNPDRLNELKTIMAEVVEVAKANEVAIREDTVDFNIERTMNGYDNFKTSMFQDFEKGNKLELDALVGVVIRKGKEKGIPTPATENVYKELIEMSFPT